MKNPPKVFSIPACVLSVLPGVAFAPHPLAGKAYSPPAAYVVAMPGGTIMASTGTDLPTVETVIALSLLCLGGLLAWGRNARLGTTHGLFIGFGLFHGSASGDSPAALREAEDRLDVLTGLLLGSGRHPVSRQRGQCAFGTGLGGRGTGLVPWNHGSRERPLPESACSRFSREWKTPPLQLWNSADRSRRRRPVRARFRQLLFGGIMASRIPVTILTGFLGAGKTTLIRHILGNACGRRIALVINEFGDLGVDGALIEGCGESACGAGEIVELTNGCICCTVSDDFVPAMESILARDELPDHVVVETSGLALPQPLVRAFNWPRLRNRLTIDGIIVVVDGKAVVEGRFASDPVAVDIQRQADANLDHESPLAELFEDQLVSADIVVVNKSDLLDPDEVDGLIARLRHESREGTRVVAARNGDLPADVVLGVRAAAENGADTRQARHHHDDEDHDHDHDEFESFVVAFGSVAEPEHCLPGLRRLSANMTSSESRDLPLWPGAPCDWRYRPLVPGSSTISTGRSGPMKSARQGSS